MNNKIKKEKTNNVSHVKTLVRKAYSDMLLSYNNADKDSVLSTGFNDLDCLCKLKKGELTILSSRPCYGKTTIALEIALNVATEQNKVVEIFSFNTSKFHITKLLLSLMAEINLKFLLSKKMQENDWEKLFKEVQKLEQLPVYIDDSSLLSINDIENKLTSQEKRPELIILDSAELLEEFNLDNKIISMENISYKLKQLATKLNIHIMILSTITKPIENQNDRKPRLKDLSRIDKYADNVILIYRKWTYSPENQQKAEIIIAKNKNADCIGGIELLFFPEIHKFKNKIRPDSKFL